MNALQTLTAPVGWQDSPPDYQSAKSRSWELTGPLRAIVVARALGGNRRGWYRVSSSVICGGGGQADKLTLNAGK